MKLHLPTKLRAALMGLAAVVAPFALTVATVSSVAVFAGVAQAEDLTLSGSRQELEVNKHYGTVTVSGTETSTIAITTNNKNLIIDNLTISEDAELTITATPCDLVVVEALSGAGDLSMGRTNYGSVWNYALAIKGINSGYTGTIKTIANNSAAGNATQVYLMGENSAQNAVIDLGDYTTLGVSTGTARIAGLKGTGSHAAVISFANPSTTQSADGLGTNSGNCYNHNVSRDTNDGTLRTLELNGSGEYSYAGRIGSETNPDKLNLTVALQGEGRQTLSGTNYINDLTLTSGDLVLSGTNHINNLTVTSGGLELSGTTTVGGEASVGEGFTLSINGNVTVSTTIGNNGTLAFGTNGSLAITGLGGLDHVGDLTYSDTVSGSTQNGYVNAYCIVVRGAGDVTGLDNVTLHGATYGLSTDGEGNRVIVFDGTGGDYYVNEGTVIYGDEGNNATSETTARIVLNGGTLTMQRDLINGVDISLAADGTVSLGSSEVTLNKDNVVLNGHTLNLDGNGTYRLGNSTAADKVSLADGWTGTIELESGTLGSINPGNSALNIKKVGTGTAIIDGTHATDISNLDIQAGTVELSAGDTGYSFGSVTIGESATLKLGGVGTRLENSTKVTMKGESSLLMDCCRAYGYATAINADITVDAEGSYVSIKGSLYGNGVDLSGSIGGSGELRFMNGNGSNSFTVSAVIGDTLRVKLDKANSTLYLSGANTYSGGTEVTAGTLEVSGNGTLGTGAVSVSGSGELILRNEALTVAGLELSGGGTVTVEENLTLTGASTLVYDRVTLKAGKSITVGAGGSLTSDGITYGNGATLTRGTNDGGLSAFDGGYSVTGGDITISAGQDNDDRDIEMEINGGNVVSYVAGTLTIKHDATMDSFVGGKTTIEGDATINGTATFEGDSSITGDAAFGGLTTLNANLTVAGDTTLSGGSASITIADGVSFTSGNETVSQLAGSTAATISGTGIVSVAREGITYTNALIDVTATNGISSIAATLSNSQVVNNNSSAAVDVSADSLADGTNDVTAAKGNITITGVGDGGVTVKNLTVQGGNMISATTADGGGTPGTIIVEDTADVAGTVSANVTVGKENSATTAVFTAKDGAAVGGNLTVTGTGMLAVAEHGAPLAVEGALTLEANSVLNLEDLAIEQQESVQTFTLASANLFVISADTIVAGLAEGLTWELTNLAGKVLLSSSGTVGTDTASPAMFSMRRAAAATDGSTGDILTLTVFGLPEKPTTLTATEVVAYDPDNKVLALNVDMEDIASLADKDLAVTVGSGAWDAIVEAMGDVHTNATITLNGESLGQFGTVSFNGYAGTGTKGEYFVAYIPEPATATLSLLALAALAARRRRK